MQGNPCCKFSGPKEGSEEFPPGVVVTENDDLILVSNNSTDELQVGIPTMKLIIA